MKIAPVKRVNEFEVPVKKRVEDILKNNPELAYHTTRIMVDFFGVKENEIGGSFKDWKDRGAVTLWRQVRNALHELVDEGKAEMQREGKVNYFWWSNHK